jgi:hypothetical protein
MSLSNNARVNAIYSAVAAANPNWNATLPSGQPAITAAEKATILAGITTVFGADLTYLIANTVVSVNTSSTIPASSITTTPAAVGSPVSGPVPSPLSVSGSGSGTIS